MQIQSKYTHIHSGWGKGRFTVVSIGNTEFILILLFIILFFIYLCPSLYTCSVYDIYQCHLLQNCHNYL